MDIRLDPGRYAVVVHLVDRQAEPGMVESGGEPAPGALPDFIVEICASPPGEVGHRTVIDTFDRP
ncbi:hypothetical protein [Streptomyces xinghaiensis]|uniref:hypothetical protein n=1 Tax=Streptomyces xinghaiensis TaxID=1038928 RepID=UPI002E1662E9|nr:hypothetical protein OG463_16970 [Streptomyces xinghaiensis]